MSDNTDTFRGWGDDALTLDKLTAMMAEFRAQHGPIIGAILVCEWWANPGWMLTVEPSETTDWEFLAGIIGAEGVELVKRQIGRQVVIASASDFDKAFPQPYPLASDTLPVLYNAVLGTPVYRLKTPPVLEPISFPEYEMQEDWDTARFLARWK